jgi:hypothetical protein
MPEASMRDRDDGRGTSLARGISRRRFLAAAAAVGTTLPFRSAAAGGRSGNSLPGRIVIREDLDATSGLSVDLAVVKQMVDQGLVDLTGEADPVSAIESLLPGLDATKKVTIKVNCLFTTNTQWQVVRAVTDNLRLMLGGTYPAGNITIFDNNSIGGWGFTAANFPGIVLGGHNPSGTQVWVGNTWVSLSSHIVNCDYLINCPVPKDHSSHLWTLGFKNHIGSVDPVICHSYEPRLLTLAASPHLKDKTRLLVLTGLYGKYNGGPTGGSDTWSLFPEEHTPNLVMLSTDPVTFEHWGIRLINEERKLHPPLPIYPDTYCEHAASVYGLGVYNFAEHEVITSLPAPASLTAQRQGTTGVRLQWSPVIGMSKYRVYRGIAPDFEPDPWGGSNLLAEPVFATYTDPAGAGDPNTNYYYVVRAYRACWESADSPRAGAFDYQT